LRSAPDLGRAQDFDRAAFGLVPASVAVVGPLVLVSFASEPRALTADLAPITDLLRAAEGLEWVGSRSYEVACNWKVFVDNYLDGGYHVPHVHRGLADELELGSYETRLHERLSIQSSGPAPRGGERIGARAQYAFVHPNWMLNRYGAVLDVNRVEPLAVDRTRVTFDWWFEAALARQPDRVAASIAQSERIQLEDVDVCTSVQRGLESPAYDRGPYSTTREAAEHHFHRLLRADLAEPPSPATRSRD